VQSRHLGHLRNEGERKSEIWSGLRKRKGTTKKNSPAFRGDEGTLSAQAKHKKKSDQEEREVFQEHTKKEKKEKNQKKG